MHEELLKRHLALVLKANETTNITSISTWEEGMFLHVYDSLAALPELNAAPEGWCVDIGSGAGYPGIPLAIESGRKTLLVDSVKKKIVILDEIIKELCLTNVETYAGRIEVLAQEMPGAFAAVTARALARLSVLMELASPLLQIGGYLICYKAHLDKAELDHALDLQDSLGMNLVSDRTTAVKDCYRRIICFTKVKESTVKLPRKVGFAQKKPL